MMPQGIWRSEREEANLLLVAKLGVPCVQNTQWRARPGAHRLLFSPTFKGASSKLKILSLITSMPTGNKSDNDNHDQALKICMWLKHFKSG